LLQHYTDRTPGSFIEEKEINLTWHYRNADPEFGSWQGSELNVNLEKMLSHMAVSIILGNKTLEIRPSSIDKSSSARAILGDFGVNIATTGGSPPDKNSGKSKKSAERYQLLPNGDIDFILCVGDGKTDEIVFQVLKESFGDVAICATVGKKQTVAGWYVEDVAGVIGLLAMLT
jgi:trehalose 6-phosphate synthase/phosphatase